MNCQGSYIETPWICSKREETTFAIKLPLMLLSAKTYLILKKKYCKKNTIRFFGSGSSKIVFALPTKILRGYAIITFINVRKAGYKKTFISILYNCGSGFYYCTNNVLYVFICVNFWRGFETCRSCCWYIERLWW